MAIATPNSMGGYDYSFVEAPHDRFICKICHLPSRNSHLSVCCGHLFCKSCLDNTKRTTAITACPMCRNEDFKTFPNKAVDREVRGLYVYCINKEKDCKWQGELNEVGKHLRSSDGCQFEEVKCSNKCGKMIQRRYLSPHVETECPCRKVNCQYCHHTGEYQFIEGQHKKECSKVPLPCPNKCNMVSTVLREDMEAHRKECPLEIIQCEYHSVGCKRVRLIRKDVEKHKKEKMEEHLMMTKNELTNTKAQLDAALKQVTSLAALVNAQLCPTTSSRDLRSFQLDAMVTMFNFVCPVTFKMSGYKKKKEDDVSWYSDPFYTHNKGYKMDLLVNAAGYDGCKGIHLSVYLCLKQGPYDDELTWPLSGMFEVKLLNQISDDQHHSHTIPFCDDPDDCNSRVTEDARGRNGFGCPRFIGNGDLHKITATHQFLKDDCLFFQVNKVE